MEFRGYTDLLTCLAKEISIVRDDEKKAALIVAIEEMYKNNSERIMYSQITAYVYNSKDEEELEIILNNLYALSESPILGNYRGAEKAILKIYDHINLARIQKKHLSDIFATPAFKRIEELSAQINGALEQQKGIDESIKKLHFDKTKIYTDFVTILGIFATIIFAAFGGLNLLNGIFTNLEDVRVGKLLIFSSLIIAAIISMLFILLNGIAKLTGLNLSSCGCKRQGDECRHNLVQRHPSIVIISLFIGAIFVEGTILYFVKYKEIIKAVYDFSMWIQGFLLFVPLILLILGLIYVNKSLKSSNGEKSEKQQIIEGQMTERGQNISV